MAHEAPAEPESPSRVRRRRLVWRWLVLPVLVILLLAIAAAWWQRERLADNAIADYLEEKGVEATYEIVSIGPEYQVIRDIVVGDPARPDLTIERAVIGIRARFGLPGVRRVELTNPRLYGTYIDGELSFGALDPLVFTGEGGPFEFPGMELAIAGGRGLLETDYGPVGIRLAGSGHLRGGFEGELAASAPELSVEDCAVEGASAYGALSIDAERPSFVGPLRVASVDCGDGGLQLASTTLRVQSQVDRDLGGVEADVTLQAAAPEFAGLLADQLRGEGAVTFRGGELVGRYDVTVDTLSHEQAQVMRLAAEGSVRAGEGFDWLRVETDLAGEGFRPGAGLDAALADAAAGAEGTLLGSVLRKVRGGLLDEATGSTLSAQASFRRTGEEASLVVPQTTVTGGSGQRVLALSRVQYALRPDEPPILSGNFAIGGRGLPRIAGQIERRGDDGFDARLAMAEYRADQGRLAIPRLMVRGRGGRIAFSGDLRASGELPGGFAENLVLPLDGSWSGDGGLALWRGCTDLRFDRLRYANLTIDGRSLTLCPARGQPIVRYGTAGLKVAAGAPSLNLTGRLGETRIAISSGPIGLALPGALSAREVTIALGPPETATRFAMTDLTAEVGEDISGRFGGTDVFLFGVPIDVRGASGDWRYANGRLTLSDSSFTLQDRAETERFLPLQARQASLALEDNVITAQGVLREPTTGRTVADADLVHSLETGGGYVDFGVGGLLFDEALKPEMLFPAAFGIVANVEGVVTGSGRIAWNAAGNVTSSGRFSSESLDLAAAFGPVRGASGTIVFTDLLGLTTAPGQTLQVEAINPGIEVYDGLVRFQLIGGNVIALEDATWPFLGGTLTMRPVRLNFGASETRAYVLDIVGLEASQFVQRMELNNLSATGTFDGTIPLIFDPAGNGRIEGGLLLSRPPGGNVAYVGELTYENLGAMANFAFDTLRSLDYRRMRVAMDGPLTGEIVARVRFDGVTQGAGTKQNILTKQIAKLPVRFDVNVRAPFYQLISSVRSLYDPAAVRDPRELGLIDSEGKVIRRESNGPAPKQPPPPPADQTPDEAIIQRSESEDVP